MQLTVLSRENTQSTTHQFDAKNLVIAGWTGRNQEAMEAHISELEELGIPRPKRTPEYYRNSVGLLTTSDEIQVLGEDSSGEIEFVMYFDGDDIFVGLGSDHTDRNLEKTSVTVSKQVCPKPVSTEVWKYSEVAGHWDKLILRSHVTVEGERSIYQEGPVTTMKDPMELIAGYEAIGGARDGLVMYCGTLAVQGGIRPAERFEAELLDPVLGRSIKCQYGIEMLDMGD